MRVCENAYLPIYSAAPIEVGLELDLHGLTTAYAEHILDEFLRDCARRNVRCALIIHGKGGRSPEHPPVLKRKVNYWLRQYDEVLTFCSATRRDGGTGALYLLLRNLRKSRRGRRKQGACIPIPMITARNSNTGTETKAQAYHPQRKIQPRIYLLHVNILISEARRSCLRARRDEAQRRYPVRGACFAAMYSRGV